MPATRNKRGPTRLSVDLLERRELLSTVITGVHEEGALGAVVRPFGELAGGNVETGGGNEFLITAPFASPEGRERAGAVYVVFGGPHLTEGRRQGCERPTAEQLCQGIEELLGKAQALRIIGAAPGDRLGFSVAAVGDVIGNSAPDLLVGAPFAELSWPTPEPADTDRGIVYLIGGDLLQSAWLRAQAEYQRLRAEAVATGRDPERVRVPIELVTIDLADLDPTATTQPGSWLAYVGAAPGDHAGFSVAGLGNGALIIGAPRAEPALEPPTANTGAAYVVRGDERPYEFTLTSLDELVDDNRGSVLFGPHPGARFGWSVSGMFEPGLATGGTAFSIDGDVLPDLLVGAPFAFADETGPGSQPGAAYFVPGTLLTDPTVPAGVYRLDQVSDRSALGLVAFVGSQDGERFGHVVSSIGDFDADGLSDFAIGAPLHDVPARRGIRTDAGAVYVVFGRTIADGSLPAMGGPERRPISAALLAAAHGMELLGAETGERAGWSIGPALNARDPRSFVQSAGTEDFLIGAPLADLKRPDGRLVRDAGRVYLVQGNPAYAQLAGASVSLAVTGRPQGEAFGAVAHGRAERQFFGTAVGSAGNAADPPLIGRGVDVLIGAPGSDRPVGPGSTLEDTGEVVLSFLRPLMGDPVKDDNPGGFSNPGLFGHQAVVAGYWSWTNRTPPAGSDVFLPLVAGVIGPFSAPYLLGSINFYPDPPVALVDPAGHLHVVERARKRVVGTDVTAEAGGPPVSAAAGLLRDRSGRARHVFAVSDTVGTFAWYQRARRGWRLRELPAFLPARIEAARVVRAKGGFVAVMQQRNGQLFAVRYLKGHGWQRLRVPRAAIGPVQDLMAVRVLRPQTSRAALELLVSSRAGQLVLARIPLSGAKPKLLRYDLADRLLPDTTVSVTQYGARVTIAMLAPDGSITYARVGRGGLLWEELPVPQTMEAKPSGGVAIYRSAGQETVFYVDRFNRVVEAKRADSGWNFQLLPNLPLGYGVGAIAGVVPGAVSRQPVLTVFDDRGVLARFTRDPDGDWQAAYAGDDSSPQTALDYLIELGLKAR